MQNLEDRIKDVYKQAVANTWNYPQLFEGLKAAGVQSYTMDVAAHKLEYVGANERVVQSGPASWAVALGTFNKEGVITAVRRSQRRETDYPTFLKEIAAAGIPRYVVSMSDRTVSYLGEDAGDTYVEKVPETK